MLFHAKHVSTDNSRETRNAFRPGEVRFYIIMVGLNVSLRNVHAETRVCLPEMNTFSHTNRAVCFWIC